VVHGGVVMAVADSATALCAQLNLPADATGTATVEAGTHFLHADGRRVSRTLQTQAILR